MRVRRPWGRNRAQNRFYEVNGYFPGVRGRFWSIVAQVKDMRRHGAFWRAIGMFILFLDAFFKWGLEGPRMVQDARFVPGMAPDDTGNQFRVRRAV